MIFQEFESLRASTAEMKDEAESTAKHLEEKELQIVQLTEDVNALRTEIQGLRDAAARNDSYGVYKNMFFIITISYFWSK